MYNVSTNLLVNRVGSAYKLVILASMRAIELSEGAANLMHAKQDDKVIHLALQEIAEGRISYKIKEGK